MKHWVHIGPVILRVSSKNLAPWGFPRIQIGNYNFWSWTNDGWFAPACYHPKGSITWVWQIWIVPFKGQKSYTHNCGSQTFHWLPFGWRALVLRQKPMWRKDLLKVAA